ncbi:hypothetical protein F5880DRAFT_1332836 [Lentinula raphanica]|nr:hypothetical protein F5880DRAFT_1332836 [Lentinula raphanica]
MYSSNIFLRYSPTLPSAENVMSVLLGERLLLPDTKLHNALHHMPRLALSLVPLKAWFTKATWAEFLPSLKTLTKLFTYQLFEEQELSGRSLPSIMLRAVQQACDRASLVSLTMFEDLTAVVMKKFSKDLSTAAFSDIVYGAERRWPVLALKG